MYILKIIATTIIVIFFIAVIALYIFQTRLIFYPGKLSKNHRFNLRPTDKEVFLKTSDDETIHGIFYRGYRSEIILYFHGNAGDLKGWQFAVEDLIDLGYNVLLIDYRGYGKSTGTISEKGFYADAEAAYQFVMHQKDFTIKDIIIYGRSVGTGVAVELASRHKVKGLILESPYTSLKKLANEKLPFFFPSLYLRYNFDNLKKINQVKFPIRFIK
jgi:pimeloyl-ACP methyl ester carboxylesterase